MKRIEKALVISALLIALLCFGVVLVNAQIEDDITVNLKRNNLTSEKWVQVLQDVVVNTTQNKLILNISSGALPAKEDFTTWIHEGFSRITFGEDWITYTGDMRFATDENMKLVTPITSSFFYAFTYNVDYVSLTTRTWRGIILKISDSYDDLVYGSDNGYEEVTLLLRSYSDVSHYQIQLHAHDGATQYASEEFTSDLDVDTNYYCTFNKSGYDYNLTVYSDSDRTIQVDNVVIDTETLFEDGSSYDGIVAMQNIGFTSHELSKSTLSNFTGISSRYGYASTGNYYSINLLENVTSSYAETIYGIVETPTGTSIELMHSKDNTTWIIYELNEDFVYQVRPFDLDSLYVRFRLNTTIDDTPKVRFYHVTHNITCGTGTSSCLIGAWKEYNVSSITLVEGTYNAGNRDSLDFVDIDIYDVIESVGSPAIDLRVNFTDVNTTDININANIYLNHTGSHEYNISIQVYNFTADSWIQISQCEHLLDLHWHNTSMSFFNNDDLIQDGKIWMRLYLDNAGNINHNVYIDYFKLRVFAPSSTILVGGGGVDWWLAILFILTPLTIILILALRRKN